jgi:hypothetical protein
VDVPASDTDSDAYVDADEEADSLEERMRRSFVLVNGREPEPEELQSLVEKAYEDVEAERNKIMIAIRAAYGWRWNGREPSLDDWENLFDEYAYQMDAHHQTGDDDEDVDMRSNETDEPYLDAFQTDVYALGVLNRFRGFHHRDPSPPEAIELWEGIRYHYDTQDSPVGGERKRSASASPELKNPRKKW